MEGKTHVAAGACTALFFFPPKSLNQMLLCLGASAVGSILPDIDIKPYSGTRKYINTAIYTPFTVTAMLLIIDSVYHAGIVDQLKKSIPGTYVASILVFALVCILGKRNSHRGFMHSIFCMVVLSGCVYVIIPIAGCYFFIGYFMHLFLDVTNKRDVLLFWPFGKGIKLNLFRYNGVANYILFCFFVTGFGLQVIKVAKDIIIVSAAK